MLSKCYLYDIIDPDPRHVDSTDWANVVEKMQDSGWFGDMGERYGFVSILTRPEIITGFFAHEGRKSGIQYNENKQPSDTATDSFEHLFFAIFTDTSQLLLQHKNIYGYDNLGLPKMRDALRESLTILFRMVQVSVASNRVQIESAGLRYSQEELYAFFESNSVFKVEIKDLRLEKIPAADSPAYNLYNPKDDWNPITWGAVADTLEVGAKNVIFEADQNDANAELNKGPLPKAFSRIGEFEEIQARNEEGRIVIRKRTNDEEISISLPSTTRLESSVIDGILVQFNTKERIDGWKKRLQQRETDQLRGTLFELNAK